MNTENEEAKTKPRGSESALTDLVMWRDLLLGEEIKLGDRCLDGRGYWFAMQEKHLEYSRVVNPSTRPIQRKVNGAKKELINKVKVILKGINETQTESNAGWWETSIGASFGHSKLEELLVEIKAT